MYLTGILYKFSVFRYVSTMMIMRWCNVQTNEYDLQAKTYPAICTHHKLRNKNENKIPIFPNIYAISDRIWCNKHLRHTTMDKYGNNGMMDTSDLMMIMIWPVEHLQPHIFLLWFDSTKRFSVTAVDERDLCYLSWFQSKTASNCVGPLCLFELFFI